MATDTVRITLRVPREVHAEIVRLAHDTDRSLNWQMVNTMKIGAAQVAEKLKEGSAEQVK